MKALLLILLLAAGRSYAVPVSNGVMQARENAMHALQTFKPEHVIEGFTPTPREANIKPNDVNNTNLLQHEASERLKEETAARFVIDQQSARAKITPNPKSNELAYAERLIDEADNAITPGCHKEPVPCEEHITESTCEERAIYSPMTCERRFNVHVNRHQHPDYRRVLVMNKAAISLVRCDDAYRGLCSAKQIIQLHARCEHLETQVILGNQVLHLSKLPTCADPTITVDYTKAPYFNPIIRVVEYWSDEDKWDNQACSALDLSRDFCVPDAVNSCIDPNQTKVIQGIPISRRCWGEDRTFQCVSAVNTTCQPLLDRGCSNISSNCTASTGAHCDVTSKTFQCVQKICFPDKEVCPQETVGCANGSCDNTVAEESDDIHEGISRLGALAGTAEDAATNQVQSRQPSIFKGAAQECEKYILGLRDCCTDDGILDGIINCPADMQVLQRAKLEHRAIYLGHYKHHLLSTTRYAYCVFPTKLAGIVQIQGRFNQLKIPFGKPDAPDCRGVTPEELERIDFKALDLSEMVNELLGKRNLPVDANIEGLNISHIDQLHEKRRAYD